MKKLILTFAFLLSVQATFTDKTSYTEMFCVEEAQLGSFLTKLTMLLKPGDAVRFYILKSECTPTTGKKNI
jgi:hypothetical protein